MRISIWSAKWWLIGIVATICSEIGNSAVAQIVPDNTLGTESSVVTPNVDIKGVPSDRIDGGAIRGANVFHSFQEFNVGEGRGAYFSNPAGIENILTRVTGTNASNIFGKLGVLGNANLFLLNPNGIIFGPNASLDISGSFVGTTANSLNFADGVFSATNPTAPPLLTVKVPLGVQFPKEQPRAIVNSGNLSAGTGQNLTLLGGTVVSTGQLSAPGGQVGVAAVPSGSLAKLNSSAQLLNIDVPSPEAKVGSSGSSSASLTDLLFSNDGTVYPGLTVNSNGQVELLRSGLPVVDGDVVARNVTAQSATLSANHNLTLVESQLGTTGNLNLLAGDTVRVRDSVANPFVAQAGGQLLVQGKQGVDIFALNNSSSGLVSGGDMVLRSLNTVGGDAHYWAGGNFRIEKLDGSLGGLFSPYDPIIRASGDVSFDRYEGGSLHILAGGSVTIPGTVTITGADENFGLPEETVTLSDGTQITIDGTTSPTLDIRAGVDINALNPIGITPNPIIGIVPQNFSVNPTNVPTNANIQIGSIVNEQPNGQIFLTNQYQPNSIVEGSITITNQIPINPSESDLFSVITLGSPVTLDARSNVQTPGIITGVAAGVGGNIKILSVGDINILQGNNGFSAGLSSVVNGGRIDQNNKSGDITLISTNGDIRTQGKVTTFTSSGQGGNIIFRARNNITIGNEIASRVLNENQNEQRGNSGNIQINSVNGNINVGAATPSILNQIASSTPNGTGGNIVLNARNGSITTTGWTVRAESQNGVAGDVTLIANNDIFSGNINATSNRNLLNGETFPPFSTISINSLQGNVFINNANLNTTNSGNSFAGDISLNGRNIQITNRSSIQSQGVGGRIFIQTNQDSIDNITISRSSVNALRNLASNLEPVREGINITSRGGIQIENSSLIAETNSTEPPGSISINATNSIEIKNDSTISTRVLRRTVTNPQRVVGFTPSITIQSNSISITDTIDSGSTQISASTFSNLGQAGDVIVRARSLLLSGNGRDETPTGLFAQAQEQGRIAGDIIITTDELRVENRALVSVSSLQGQAGNLEIFAKNISLNGGRLSATTGSNRDEANIFLQGLDNSPLDLLHLQNESLIAANANNSATGGNITINTRLLLALPPTGPRGSDITANALRGEGGKVKITAIPLGIYGIEFRPETTSLNDITASSETGRAGIVSIRLPDVDPRRGLLQLPEDLGDSSRFIDPSCPVGGKRARSRFVVTGRGGLPPSPSSVINSDILLGDSGAIATPPENNSPAPIVEAQGVKIGPKGEIILAANPSQLSSSYSPWQPFTRGCYEK